MTPVKAIRMGVGINKNLKITVIESNAIVILYPSWSSRDKILLIGREPWSSGDSCLKGRGFESLRCILDGHFFTLI